MSRRIALRDALAQSHSDGLLLRSYESYRKDAQAQRCIFIGERTVAVEKIGRAWTVDADEFAAAVTTAQEQRAAEQRAVTQADRDYEERRLHPSGRARLSWGSYYVSGAFHFISSDYSRMRMRSNGGWRCNTCWEPASTENEKPECHRCSDWGPCGTDCTLSRVFCIVCATSMDLQREASTHVQNFD